MPSRKLFYWDIVENGVTRGEKVEVRVAMGTNKKYYSN